MNTFFLNEIILVCEFDKLFSDYGINIVLITPNRSYFSFP
jgi:hypothetical protein